MSADVSENIGRIEVIHGCMFSGKSSQLLDRLIAAADDGRSVRAFKHRADNRYASGEIVTHDGRHASAIGVTQASTLLDRVDAGDFVVVDEAQFFSDDLVGVCQALAARGCEVVVAGLDLDSWNLPFGHILALAEVADEVVQLHTRCAQCGDVADCTQRLTDVAGANMIGGPESYEPRCRQCFVPPPLALRC